MKRILLMIYALMSAFSLYAQVAYELVTDVSFLAEGDVLVVANADYQTALGPQSGNYRSGVSIAVSGNTISGEGMTLLVLEKSGSNWVLKTQDTGKYLYAKGSSNAILETNTVSTAGTKVTFTIVEGKATVKFNKGSHAYLRFSPGPPHDFRGYDYATSKEDIQIYRRTGGETGINIIGQFDNLQYDKVSEAWYDLQGRKIVKPSNGQMLKGVYIQNGRQVLVK